MTLKIIISVSVCLNMSFSRKYLVFCSLISLIYGSKQKRAGILVFSPFYISLETNF